MRRPFRVAAIDGLGLYNDMTGDFDATNTWLGWITEGGVYDQTNELSALSPMPTGWQTAPVGGEQTHSMSDDELYGQFLIKPWNCLPRKSHTTFIGPHGPKDIPQASMLQEGVDKVLAAIGYRLYVKQLILPRRVIYGSQLQFRLQLSNDGIAPLYYAWPVYVYVLAEDGSVSAQYKLDLDVRKVLPGELMNFNDKLPIEQLENGKYTVGIAVLDPLTNQPAVRFAMRSVRNDRIQELGSFEVRRLF